MKELGQNFSCPSSPVAVVFGSAGKSLAIGPCDYFLLYGNIVMCLLKRKRSMTQFAIARFEFN